MYGYSIPKAGAGYYKKEYRGHTIEIERGCDSCSDKNCWHFSVYDAKDALVVEVDVFTRSMKMSTQIAEGTVNVLTTEGEPK